MLKRVNGLASIFNFKLDQKFVEQKRDLEVRVTAARNWKECAVAAFLKRPGSNAVSLLDCLLPRNRGNLLRSSELGPRGRRGRQLTQQSQTSTVSAASNSSPALSSAAATALDTKSGGPLSGSTAIPDGDSSASTMDVTVTPTDSPAKSAAVTLKDEVTDPDSTIPALLSWLEKNNAFTELYARKFSYEDPKHTADIVSNTLMIIDINFYSRIYWRT